MSDLGGEGYNLHNVLTNLAVRVGQLEGTMKTFMENWAAQDKLAHESRRIVYDRIDLISKQVDRVAVDVQNVQQDVAELKEDVEEKIMPTVLGVQAEQQRKLGAKSVWALIVAGVMATVSVLAYIADRVATYLFHKP